MRRLLNSRSTASRWLPASAALLALLLVFQALALTAAAKDLGVLRQESILPAAHQALLEIEAKSLERPAELTLYAVGEEAFDRLDPALFTGYSVKDGAESAGFDLARTVRYGHSSTGHLLELVAVMKHRGFNPRLSVESRISSYVHLLEWGEPWPGTRYTPIDDTKGIIYVKEYDALFEFASEEELVRFDEFIRSYAQKEQGKEDRYDLVAGSWYVPLYTVAQPLPGYRQVKEIRVTYGDNYMVNYALEENADSIAEGLRALAGEEYSVSVGDIWVNESFYYYLGGE